MSAAENAAAGAVDDAPWDADRLLAHIGGVLGPDYQRHDDACFRWLSPLPPDEHAAKSEQARHAVARVGELLPGLDPRPPPGGWPAILLDGTDDHLAYEDLFAGGNEGPRIIGGGVWRSWPVGHLPIPLSDWDALDAAFAHELVHASFHGSRVPVWIQEGIATEVETRMGNRLGPFADRHSWHETLLFWRGRAAEPFWTGAAFGDPALSQHAYRLAQAMAGAWLRDPAMPGRLRAAGWDDPDAALRGLISVDRAALLAGVLTPQRRRGWFERWLYGLFAGDDP